MGCFWILSREGRAPVEPTPYYVGNLPDGYTRTGSLPRVNPGRVNQSGLSLVKPGKAHVPRGTWHAMVPRGSCCIEHAARVVPVFQTNQHHHS